MWLPNLAPSEALLKPARAALAGDDERGWKSFARRYRTEMKTPENQALLDTLAMVMVYEALREMVK